ncbi:MAG: hypothetical protein WDN30_10250 [Pararobbsia sp.]
MRTSKRCAARALLEEQPCFSDLVLVLGEHRYRLYFWVTPFGDGHGHTAGLLGGWLDVTERGRLEDALRLRETRPKRPIARNPRSSRR